MPDSYKTFWWNMHKKSSYKLYTGGTVSGGTVFNEVTKVGTFSGGTLAKSFTISSNLTIL